MNESRAPKPLAQPPMTTNADAPLTLQELRMMELRHAKDLNISLVIQQAIKRRIPKDG